VEWYWWVVIAVVFAAVEITTLDLFFLMLAVGALAGAAVSLAVGSIIPEAIVAGAVAILMLAVVRPIALSHLRTPLTLRSGTDALLGQQGLVLERVDGRDGRVKIGGETWSARSYDPDLVLEPGTTVDVYGIDGATAVVYPSE